MIYSPYGVLVEVTKVFDVYVVLIGLIVCEKSDYYDIVGR